MMLNCPRGQSFSEASLVSKKEKSAKKKTPYGQQDVRVDLVRSPRILIVEDERLVAENIKEFLQSQGYTVAGVVTSGEDVIRSFNQLDPDLILMDIRLRGVIDGIQTAIVIQQTIKLIPIVFLTAFSQDHFPHLNRVTSASFTYLTKPYSHEELITAIEQMLRGGKLPD